MDAGTLDRRITLLQRNTVQDADYGTQTVTWGELATVWANVQDMIPSRAERVAEGIDLARRPCRVRIRWRDDVNTTMRMTYEGRDYRIVTQPAELGRRDGMEFMAEEVSTGGQEP